MRDPRIHEIQDHLYNGLAIMDLVGHIEALNALWRRDSVTYAMRLAFREWKAADDLLSELAEELHGPCWKGLHVPRPATPGEAEAGMPPPADERVAGPPS